ncbi:MAG: hypothetical protein KIT16_00260 [Rhodospirillaceae bacterium]|nr:hypothetical protein [Rhodospirillaceae bacterium]
MSAQPTAILVERRFPLDLSHTIATIRDLYDASKAARWDPIGDIPWDRFDVSTYDAATLAAARLSWSRRTWTEYTGLPETPALLIRFCLEVGREADPKYFLSVRSTEEAWHVEACHRFAKVLGGFVDAPADPAYAALFETAPHRRALDADISLDGYVAAHCAVEDGLELELWRGYLANARDPVAQALLARCVEDKKRHAAFGWLYLEERARNWDAPTRETVRAAVAALLQESELKGYHCAWLAGDMAADVVAADRATAAAGLGALTPEEEATILRNYMATAREKLHALGVELAPVDDPRTGRL